MISEGYMPFKNGKTYYRIVNKEGSKTPLILLHGGPGSTHNYFEVFDHLAIEDDRPIIMYDQIGCGKSYVDGDETIFSKETWSEELIALREHLEIKNCHILGQSWGGMLLIIYAVDKNPSSLKSLILSSTLSSAKLWRKENLKRVELLPDDMKKAIYDAENKNDYSSEKYKEAIDLFMQRYCAKEYDETDPECLRRKKVSGAKSYLIAWGENEFTPTGTLADYEYTDKLKNIKIPTLITSGSWDLSTPYIAKTMHDNIENSKWELFQHSRHMPFVEEHEKYVSILKKWLNKND